MSHRRIACRVALSRRDEISRAHAGLSCTWATKVSHSSLPSFPFAAGPTRWPSEQSCPVDRQRPAAVRCCGVAGGERRLASWGASVPTPGRSLTLPTNDDLCEVAP